MFEQFDDLGAVRCAVADILIAISGGQCSEGSIKEVRELLEKAVDVVHRSQAKEVKA